MIRFHYHHPSFRIPSATRVKHWLERAAKTEKKKILTLDYIFVSDEELRAINKQTLNHDYYTDILTFPYAYQPIEGELYISIDRIKDHAVQYKVPFQHELRRVMVHGLLHLCGYDDATDRKQKLMRRMEDKYLKQIA